jgi:hypothetical protein
MPRPLKVLLRDDLSSKGIPWSRQHINRKIEDGTFPPPDGRTGDSPTAPRFWFEETIDNYLRDRAKKMKAMRAGASPDTS